VVLLGVIYALVWALHRGATLTRKRRPERSANTRDDTGGRIIGAS
jgi:hypothetical protein